MAKQQPQKEKPKPKTLKEQKKEIEMKLVGEKNGPKKKELMGMLKKIEFEMKQELDARKREEEAKKASKRVVQLIPVGVDPKTVLCLNFQHGVCDKGDQCQFAHELKKEAAAEKPEEASGPRKVCRFLLDAINGGEYTPNWKCPLPKCSDVHKLVDLGKDSSVEVSLEEYIELQRQSLDDERGTPVTAETFKAWREKKRREEELHAKRVAALSTGMKGVDLFKLQPEMFEDDNEAVEDDVDYTARNYEDFEELEAPEGVAAETE